jgi:hypothetical protein
MNRSFQMFEGLAESETQPGKEPKLRPHAEIGTFNVASAAYRK